MMFRYSLRWFNDKLLKIDTIVSLITKCKCFVFRAGECSKRKSDINIRTDGEQPAEIKHRQN